jgi:hypothetical protein
MVQIWALGRIVERLREHCDWDAMNDDEKAETLAATFRADFDEMKVHRGKTVSVVYLGVSDAELRPLISVEIV